MFLNKILTKIPELTQENFKFLSIDVDGLDYEIWKKGKQREAESWSERWKWAEAGFLILLSIIMLGLWFLI